MEIYTSYFSKLKNKPEGLTAISIARWSPTWTNQIKTYMKLAPTTTLLLGFKNGHIDQSEYIIQYKRDTLYRTPVVKILEDLKSLKEKEDVGIVLYCYEKPSEFCHRHLVAEHLTKCSNLIVRELEY